jgi:hypothetical protein
VATAAAEAEMAVAVVASTAAVSAVAVSTAVAFVADVSAVALSTVVAFAVAVLVGATGMATGTITDSLMMSSSSTSAFRGGGAGTIRTDITVTAITRTVIMDTAGTHTATTMDTADTVTMVGPVTDTARAADQGISGVCGVGDMPGYGSLKSLAF